jgi:hypothetical protein
VRRDAVVFDRESDQKRRVDEERLGGAKKLPVVGEVIGGEFGPRRSLRRWSAIGHSVHGSVCDSPMCPQP